jgi:AAA+ superfamily predicted ATPase
MHAVTSLAQVAALVDAHVNRDHDRFRAVTLQIAAHISSRSEHGAAQLRKLVDRQQNASFVPLPSANGLLSSRHDLATLDDMVLAPLTRNRLDRVVLEHERRIDLMARDLRPMRKLLFTGPPGVGKTMAAGAVAAAIKMPLFRVELHGVIASYLGETASKLAKVFEHVRAMPAVYLFDEFDAIGSERSAQGNDSAGGEMRRVVNSLLQFIEDDRSDSLIIAATNHSQMLDSAIFRRFDETIAFETLTTVEVIKLTRRKLDGFTAETIDHEAILAASPRLGHADLCAALDRVRKDHVIAETTISTTSVVAAISRRIVA